MPGPSCPAQIPATSNTQPDTSGTFTLVPMASSVSLRRIPGPQCRRHSFRQHFVISFRVKFGFEMSAIVVLMPLPVNEIARKFSGTFGLALLVRLERLVPTWQDDSIFLLVSERKILRLTDYPVTRRIVTKLLHKHYLVVKTIRCINDAGTDGTFSAIFSTAGGAHYTSHKPQTYQGHRDTDGEYCAKSHRWSSPEPTCSCVSDLKPSRPSAFVRKRFCYRLCTCGRGCVTKTGIRRCSFGFIRLSFLVVEWLRRTHRAPHQTTIRGCFDHIDEHE
jgi:hypothetical protein